MDNGKMMRGLAASLIVGVGLAVADGASGETITQTGEWINTTFDEPGLPARGALRFDIEITGLDYTLTMDADGFVFGFADPPPVDFSGTFNGDGSVTISEVGHPIFGDLSGFLATNGDLTLEMMPPDQLGIFSMTVEGNIGETESSGTYVVNFNDPAGPPFFGTERIEGNDFALGTFATQVPEPTSLALLALGGMLVARRRRA